jgi:6-phosphogluconolactonase
VADPARTLHSDDPVRAAGRLLARRLEAAGPAPRLAIPGGSALAALKVARAALGSTWARVRLTWVDERCVPFASAESNRGAAYRGGALTREAPPAAELLLYEDGEAAEDAVRRVERAIDARFDAGLDVLLLGMGEDGHIASLFPGRSSPAGARVEHVSASPKPPPDRITLTRALLDTARSAILLVSGEAKREALERLVAGDPSLPAHGLPGLDVVTDLDLDSNGELR